MTVTPEDPGQTIRLANGKFSIPTLEAGAPGDSDADAAPEVRSPALSHHDADPEGRLQRGAH